MNKYIVVYIASVVSLFFYSFTQIDLSLTFSSVSIWLPIQQFFQSIGYFNRPESTYWYVITMAVMFLSYAFIFLNRKKMNITHARLVKILLVIVGLSMIAYPAFSYDVYNYMFDARIVTKYAENPYIQKADDYQGDQWISFMRWTHRTYPYGPVWLGLTVPLSYLGIQKFLITLYLFKALAMASYIASVVAISKILQKVKPKLKTYGTMLFALSPLVLLEGVVSAHNDIVMMALALWSFYYLAKKRFFWAGVFLVLSIGIKFATAFLIPVYAYVFWLHLNKKKINWDKILVISLIFMLGAIVAATYRTQFQPWYLLYSMPFIALLAHRKSLVLASIIISISAALQYVPFLYTGNWDPPIPTILNAIMLIGVALAGIASIMYQKASSVVK